MSEDRTRGALLGFARAIQRGGGADLESAIADLRTAVDSVPSDHPDVAKLLSSLGSALMLCADTRGDATDADEAVDLSRRALGLLPPSHPDHIGYLANVGNALCVRARLGRDLADADEAVDVLHTASAAVASNDPFASRLRAGLGMALTIWQDLRGTELGVKDAAAARRYMEAGAIRWETYVQRGRPDDLVAAVESMRRGADSTPNDDPARAGYLSDLAYATRVLAERTNSSERHDDAVEAARLSLAASSSADPERGGRMVNLAAALTSRGGPRDLTEAVEVARHADEIATPDNDRMRFAIQVTLGAALMRRYFEEQRDEDLAEAVVTARRALRAARATHSGNVSTATANLATGLTERFVRKGEKADIDEAIAHLGDLAREAPLGEPGQVDVLQRLANALVARFERFGDQVDVDEAVRLNRIALDAVPDDHSKAVAIRLALALSLEARAALTQSQDDLEEARALRA